MSWHAHPSAPSFGQRLCALEEVPEASCAELRYGGGDDAFTMLLYRAGPDVKVYVNRCPHFSLPLNSRPGEFLLLGDARIMCAYHCAIFRLQDGRCIDGPALGMALDSVPVEIREGSIFVASSTDRGA